MSREQFVTAVLLGLAVAASGWVAVSMALVVFDWVVS